MIETKYEEEINCRADMKFKMERDKRKKKREMVVSAKPNKC
jgi:hypothetical protein